MVLGTVAAVAQQAAPEPTIKPGSTLSLEPLAGATWVQGGPLKEFEAGKIYMFECWATWCGPCIAAIPHVNDLYKKYESKGFRVIGVNVWEDGLDKVQKFVEGKGDGMSYPVVYTGKGSEFENVWLKGAGVRGIPHAFLVKDGKLLFTTHPAQLTDEMVGEMLATADGAEKAAAKIKQAEEGRNQVANTMRAFREAAAKGDADAMAARIAEVEKLDPKAMSLPGMKLDLLIARKDWEGATKLMQELPAGPARQMPVMMTANKILTAADDAYPLDFIKAVCKAYADQNSGLVAASPYSGVMLASLQWKCGEKEAAVASAKACAEAAAKAAEKGAGAANAMPALPAAPFADFAKSFEEGKPMPLNEFSAALSKAMREASPK